MRKRVLDYKKVALASFFLCIFVFLTSCTTPKMRDYYSQKENYISATGIVINISYNEDMSVLYLGFSDLEPKFDDIDFDIVGDNLSIVRENGIDEKIKIGDQVDFITAPKYFGDGYVMPIVAISVNEEVLLNFQDGYDNFMKWLG